MQLTSLLLLALGATTLATPIDISDASSDKTNGTTSSSTEHRLEKRGTYGWIASYSDLDFKCHGGYADNRPEISTDCVNFTPVGGHIGINWGTWPYAFDSLNVYSHADCINKIAVIKGPAKHNRDGQQFCWNVWNKRVRSVRSSNTAGDAPT